MPQQTLELHNAALTGLQKLPQLREQRRERPKNGGLIFQLEIQLATPPEPLAIMEALAQISAAPREPVEYGKRVGSKSPCEPGTREPQYLSDSAYTHPGQTLERFLGPPKCRKRQRHQLPHQPRHLRDDERFTDARCHQRSERRRCQCDHGLQSQRCALTRQSAAKARHAVEEVQATLDLQHESVRRYKAYAWRKPLRTKGETLEVFRARPGWGFPRWLPAGDSLAGRSVALGHRPNEMDPDPQLRRSDWWDAGKALSPSPRLNGP
jgi:hypothetical protein